MCEYSSPWVNKIHSKVLARHREFVAGFKFVVTKRRNELQWSTMTYNDLQWPTMSYNDLQWATMTYNEYWSIEVNNDYDEISCTKKKVGME